MRSFHYAINNRTVGFEIGNYDQSKPLVIDPLLSYSALIDGEFINAIAVGGAFPNIYAAKVNSNGKSSEPDVRTHLIK